MSDITIDIINPVRPYILFKNGKGLLCGYVDTSNTACGVIPIDVRKEYYARHKEDMEKAYARLQEWINPLWDKWQNGVGKGIEIGYENREWLINTPIDQLVDAEHCPPEIRQVVDELKALAIFYKYSSRKLEGDSFVEMYSYGRKQFTEVEQEYIRRGEQLDKANRNKYFGNNLFRFATNDEKVLTAIEKHLYEIKPHRHHLFQLEIDKVKHIITNESSLFGKNDWVGFVLDNPTKEKVQAAQKWVDSIEEHSRLSYLMLFGAVQEGDEVHYKVMYLFNMYESAVAPYRKGCKKPSGYLSYCCNVAAYKYNLMDNYRYRKQFVDDWFDNVAEDNDYCLLKRGKTLDIRTKDALVSGAMEDTSAIWPYLQPDLNLVEKPEAQYYCYIKAYSGYFGDEKGQVLLDIEDL